MKKIIKKICGEGTIFEDEQMRFNLATKLWNEIKSRYPDVDFDWIDFGFLDDKYIIARIDGRIIGAMNIVIAQSKITRIVVIIDAISAVGTVEILVISFSSFNSKVIGFILFVNQL